MDGCHGNSACFDIIAKLQTPNPNRRRVIEFIFLLSQGHNELEKGLQFVIGMLQI